MLERIIGLTVAWHVHHEINVDIHKLSQAGIDAKLVVPPPPKIVAKVVEDEYKRNNHNYQVISQ